MKDSYKQNNTLTARQKRALPILLSARNVADGCRRAGIGRGIFYQWLKQDCFKEEYDRQSTELVQESINDLKLASVRAVGVLNSLLSHPLSSVRFKAAARILDSIERLFLDNLESRLLVIERELGREKNDKPVR